MANPRGKDYARIGFFYGLCLTLIFLLTSLMLFFQLFQKQPPYYGVQSQNGEISKQRIVSEDRPLVSRQMILNWASVAVTSVFTFDASNYQTVIPTMVQRYFVPGSVDVFFKAILASGQVQQVVSKQLIISCVVSDTPVILESGVLFGAQSWKVQVPILLGYQSASEVRQDNQMVTLLIRTVPTSENPYGVGIEQFTVTKG